MRRLTQKNKNSPTEPVKGLAAELRAAADELEEEQIESFERHLNRCYFKEGDLAKFKRPKRGAPVGVVDYIERDIKKVFWDGSGTTPRYIRLKMPNGTFCWVCESKINYVAKGSQ